jgi:hypothetical protein
MPVTLPPGRFRLTTKPVSIGSLPIANYDRDGGVVATFAARAAGSNAATISGLALNEIGR